MVSAWAVKRSFLNRELQRAGSLLERAFSSFEPQRESLKAHYNVCRHRGAQLCATPQDSEWNVDLVGGVTPSGFDSLPRLHQWTYNLEGQLIGAPYLKDAEGFCKEDFHFYPVGVDTWGGFFFLNLNPKDASAERRDVRYQLGGAVQRICALSPQRAANGHSITYDVAANWKILMENYNECYHWRPAFIPNFVKSFPISSRREVHNLRWMMMDPPIAEGLLHSRRPNNESRALPGPERRRKGSPQRRACFSEFDDQSRLRTTLPPFLPLASGLGSTRASICRFHVSSR